MNTLAKFLRFWSVLRQSMLKSVPLWKQHNFKIRSTQFCFDFDFVFGFNTKILMYFNKNFHRCFLMSFNKNIFPFVVILNSVESLNK